VPVDADDTRGPPLELTVRTGEPTEVGGVTGTAGTDGTVRLQWDPAAPPVDQYRVHRTIGDETEELVGQTDETTWIDTAAPAGVAVTYRVEVVRGESAAPHTAALEVTTPAIPAPTVTWGTTRLRGGVASVIDPVTFTLTGQPYRAARVELTGEDREGSPVTRRVELA